jgi:hypothetical protein
MKPAALERLGRGGRVLEVALHHHVAAEHHLAQGLARGAESAPLEHRPVRERQQRAGHGAAPATPPAATEARAEPAPLTPERLRPSPDNVLDCKDAPKTAVTQVPAEIARWATVYCLKSGHVFTTNDRHFARFPRTPVLGRFNAAEMTGRADNLGHAAHFTRIAYAPLPKAEADALIAAADPTNAAFLRGKDLFRLDLAVDTGQSFAMVLIDPGNDPFWVLTLAEGKPAKSFFVASLDHMNQRR